MDSSSKKSNMSTTQEKSCTDVDSDHAVATTQYYRWFVIQSVDSDNPINKLSRSCSTKLYAARWGL